MQIVKPGVESDYLLHCPGGRLLQLPPVEDVDEAPGDDGLGGQLQLETILLNTRSSIDFQNYVYNVYCFLCTTCGKLLLNSVHAQNVITFFTFSPSLDIEERSIKWVPITVSPT